MDGVRQLELRAMWKIRMAKECKKYLRTVKMAALAGCLGRRVLETRCGMEESLIAKLSILCKTGR